MSDDKKTRDDSGEVLRMTTEIISSYLGNNMMPSSEIPELIRSVHGAIAGLDGAGDRKETPKPAVPIRKSITPDHIICLEDGKKLKMLKRHLRTTYNLTPEEYRAKWGLPPDYPMVAPNYAAQRSQFAKKIGLGRKRRAS